MSLADIAKHKSDSSISVIANWMSNRNTIELWEYGKNYTNHILNPPNSRGLKKRGRHCTSPLNDWTKL